MGCESQDKDAVQLFLEQVKLLLVLPVILLIITSIVIIMNKVDVVKQLVSYYPDDLAWATTADQIEEAFASGDDTDHYHDYNELMMMTTRSNCESCWCGVRACHWKQPCNPQDTLQVGTM